MTISGDFFLRIFRFVGTVVLVVGALFLLIVLLFRMSAFVRESDERTASLPSHGRMVVSKDWQIFIQERGPVSGVPVVLVHGTGAWSEMWDETLDVLAGAGFRAIGVDLPPFGYSEKQATADYSKGVQAERLMGVLDALELPRAVFVGHSFGSAPVMEAVLRYPDRVHALVLVDPALGLGVPGASPVMKMLAGIGPIRSLFVSTTLTNPLATRFILTSLVARADAVTDERVAMLQKPLTLKGTTPAVSSWLLRFFVPGGIFESDKRAEYLKFAKPTLVVWGREDSITPLAQGEELVRLIPGSELFVMDGVGHIPQIENPTQFNAKLVDFLIQQK